MSVHSASFARAEKAKGPRTFYLDIIRAFSCLSVVMIHVCASCPENIGSTGQWIVNLLDSLSKAGVPLFVMLSGALLLDEKRSFTRERWLGRLGKMAAFFFFWSIAYGLVFQVLEPALKHESIDPAAVVWAILKGHYHLWFVPMIFGLYLLLPLLRLWVNRANRRHVKYFLILAGVFSFLAPQCAQLLASINPGLEPLQSLTDSLHMQYTAGFTAYFVLGWYLNHLELRRKRLLYALGLAGACVTVLGTRMLSALPGASKYLFQDSFAVNVLLYSAALFVLAKSAFGHVQYAASLHHRAIFLISKYSMGVYAVHVLVLRVMLYLLNKAYWLAAFPFIYVLCVGTSILICFVARRIPFLRRFV